MSTHEIIQMTNIFGRNSGGGSGNGAVSCGRASTFGFPPCPLAFLQRCRPVFSCERCKSALKNLSTSFHTGN